MQHFKIYHRNSDSRARAGELITPHGLIETPVFMPVGTQGTVKTMGADAVSLTGSQVAIHTDSAHEKARIKKIESEKIMDHLKAGRIVVVAGFQGINERGEITTLGRGGSDTSAVALAAALGTVSYQAIKAAVANPVDSLRHE